MKIWIVTGKSESGDIFEPLAFSEEPTKKILKKIAYAWDGDEEDQNGCGYLGSYVHLSLVNVTVDDFLK